MSAITVTNPLHSSLIDAAIENDECPFCEGNYTEIDDQRVCEDCWCTPYGEFVDPPTIPTESNDHRDRYRVSDRVIQYGGYETAYRDPTNGLSYCLDAMDYEHHDGLVIWNHRA